MRKPGILYQANVAPITAFLRYSNYGCPAKVILFWVFGITRISGKPSFFSGFGN
jgi:hypothetical protein